MQWAALIGSILGAIMHISNKKMENFHIFQNIYSSPDVSLNNHILLLYIYVYDR